MRHREEGFIYPLTLCLLIVFLLFFSIQIGQLTAQRKQSHEAGSILLEEYYLHSSVTKIENLLLAGENIPAKGIIVYQKGKIDYTAETPNGTVQRVNFTLTLQSGESVFARGYFDTGMKKFIRWVEG
ncbi:competence type IV pilus minor pilin ComGG [Neobacillus muris]|uniref:competence type IV pilus minor pilin ComGG n=1 Tax=Neobacillus muris TaxID=2941334 RepID=UPI00203AEAAB|nr:competence type IV pilus minor pilin ComGG [Neobacillus muris]